MTTFFPLIVNINNQYGRTQFNIGPYEGKYIKNCFQETTNFIEC